MENWFFDHFFSNFLGFRMMLKIFGLLIFTFSGLEDFPAGVDIRRLGRGGASLSPSSAKDKVWVQCHLGKRRENEDETHLATEHLKWTAAVCTCALRESFRCRTGRNDIECTRANEVIRARDPNDLVRVVRIIGNRLRENPIREN